MKQIIAIAVMFAASVGVANAGNPRSVVNATGTATYGTGPALSVEKDTSAGNRAKVRYPSGYQYITDDASWSKFAQVVSGLDVAVAANPNLVYDASKAIINCANGQSIVSWTNVGQPEALNDGCALANAVKQVSQ